MICTSVKNHSTGDVGMHHAKNSGTRSSISSAIPRILAQSCVNPLPEYNIIICREGLRTTIIIYLHNATGAYCDFVLT